MRRSGVVVLAAILCGSLWFAGGMHGIAQDAGRMPHPAAGVWLVESEPDLGEMGVRSLLLATDGSAGVVSSASPGLTSLGAWKPTGDSTAHVTAYMVTDGPAYIVLRMALEIGSDGQTLTGTFTLEMVFDPTSPDGSSGEIGPGSVTGTRVMVEGPGTPTSSFDDFFAVPEPAAAATPAG